VSASYFQTLHDAGQSVSASLFSKHRTMQDSQCLHLISKSFPELADSGNDLGKIALFYLKRFH
jgi:hypothetical protein